MDTRAKQFYTNHPGTKAMLAELKHSYDNRQAHSDCPRSLEAHFRKYDLGNGEVRMEDFKAGWALGGVKLSPHALSAMRGAYGSGGDGTPPGGQVTIRWAEVVADLDALGHGTATNMTMSTRMGAPTARFVGYTEAGVGMGGIAAATLPPPKLDPSLTVTRSIAALTDTSSPSSLLRATHCREVAPAVAAASGATGTFNVTEVTSAAVTRRRTATHPRSAAHATDRILGALAAAGTTGIMAEALRAYDPDATGCVALDAFLTAAARAGVTVQPEELEMLRGEGAVRRPYTEAPELIEYANLPGLVA